MITVHGVDLDDRYSWFASSRRHAKQAKVKQGVILLVSIQNAEKQWPAWQQMIKSLNPLPEKVIFCENDSTDKTRELIAQWDFPHELITFRSEVSDTQTDLYAVIAKNRQLLLERARAINPQYAIFLDDDVFPDDQNFIAKITAHRLPIVGGAYLRPFEDKGMHVASKWDIRRLADMPQTKNLYTLVENVKRQGFPYIIFTACDRLLYRVALTSAGCLCLSDRALKNPLLNFFPIPHSLGTAEGCSEDFGFCLLAKKLGYKVFLDGNTRLAHLLNPDKSRPWIIQRVL